MQYGRSFWIVMVLVYLAISKSIADGVPLDKDYLEKQKIIKAVNKRLPQLKTAQSAQEVAILLRNLVFTQTKLGALGLNLPLNAKVVEAILNGEMPSLCGGMALVYSGLLEIFGVNSRLLFLADQPIQNTHASVEVFLNGKWVIEDPTFNIHWEVDGKPVGAMELAFAYQAGKTPVAKTDGYVVPANRAVENYLVPYKNHLAHISIQDIDLFGPAAQTKDILNFPDGYAWMTPVAKLNAPQAQGKVFKAWEFVNGLPEDWNKAADEASFTVLNFPQKGILFETNYSRHELQLASEPFQLLEGEYEIQVKGAIIKGGLMLFLLDKKGEQIAVEKRYHYYDFNDKPIWKTVIIPFKAKESSLYYFNLYNLSDSAWYSIWGLQEIKIVKKA